jgi:hypothetical protein
MVEGQDRARFQEAYSESGLAAGLRGRTGLAQKLKMLRTKPSGCRKQRTEFSKANRLLKAKEWMLKPNISLIKQVVILMAMRRFIAMARKGTGPAAVLANRAHQARIVTNDESASASLLPWPPT